VHVRGDWLPRALFGRLHAVLAYLRCFVVALAVLAAKQPFQVAVLDQVSAPIALLRAFSAIKARALGGLRRCALSAHTYRRAGVVLLPLSGHAACHAVVQAARRVQSAARRARAAHDRHGARPGEYLCAARSDVPLLRRRTRWW
jgi:hypothetical protein